MNWSLFIIFILVDQLITLANSTRSTHSRRTTEPVSNRSRTRRPASTE